MKSPFASSSIGIHMARGVLAALFAAFAMRSFQTANLPSTVGGMFAIGGALFMLRGCPMCWTIGLVETIAAHFRRRKDSRRLPQPSRPETCEFSGISH
jgi:hypothetical protein